MECGLYIFTMSNLKTTQLNPRNADQISFNDLFPFVDVDAITSPTGETVHATLNNLAIKLSEIISPTFSPYDVSNGLYFSGSNGGSAYSTFQSIGSSYTLSTRMMVESASFAQNGVLFGVGTSVTNSINGDNAFYVGIENSDLIGYYHSSGPNSVDVTIPGFFDSYFDKTVHVTLSVDNGSPKIYVNGVFVSAVSSSITPHSVNSSFIFLNQSATGNNIKYVVYDAQVWNKALTKAEAKSLFFAGPKNNDNFLIASYVANNLSATQWIDVKNKHHLLVPVNGAKPTEPPVEFNVRFFMTSSGYMGNGTARDVLPEKYVLTSAMVSSSLAPLLSIGSSGTTPISGDSGLGSFNNNRVAWTSASYGINPLDLLTLGIAHPDKTLYVSMSSNIDCLFDFRGYIRD